MENVTVETIAAMDFYRGILKGREAVVVRSGIGKVNAAVCTQILADHYHVTAVINTGIAGSLKNEINIGDVVLSTDTVHHDMDATGFGYPAGQIPQMKEFAFQADERLRNLAEKCCREVNPEIGVFTGRVVSGDQFISDRVKKTVDIPDFRRILHGNGRGCHRTGGILKPHPFSYHKSYFR